MQADEEVGKIAQAVPVIISRTLELFVESLLTKSSSITNSRNAKTLSPSHLKQCIMSESRFDFLKDLVKTVPDIAMEEGAPSTSLEESSGEPSASSRFSALISRKLTNLISYFRQWSRTQWSSRPPTKSIASAISCNNSVFFCTKSQSIPPTAAAAEVLS